MNYAYHFATGGDAKDPDQYLEANVYAHAGQQAPHWSESVHIIIGSVDHQTWGWLEPAKARQFAYHLLACATCAEQAQRARQQREAAASTTTGNAQ